LKQSRDIPLDSQRTKCSKQLGTNCPHPFTAFQIRSLLSADLKQLATSTHLIFCQYSSPKLEWQVLHSLPLEFNIRKTGELHSPQRNYIEKSTKSAEHKTPKQHIYSFEFNLLFTFEENVDFKIRSALSLELFSISFLSQSVRIPET
jgi:hypothetical protein